MKAQVCRTPGLIDSKPLIFEDVDRPPINSTELLLQVHACGVCHTDLHVVEGELPHTRFPIIPGHEVVGEVVEIGSRVKKFEKGSKLTSEKEAISVDFCR